MTEEIKIASVDYHRGFQNALKTNAELLDSANQTNQALCKKLQQAKELMGEMADVLREVLHHAMGAGSNWELTHQYPDKASDMDWIGRKTRDALSKLPKEYKK